MYAKFRTNFTVIEPPGLFRPILVTHCDIGMLLHRYNDILFLGEIKIITSVLSIQNIQGKSCI